MKNGVYTILCLAAIGAALIIFAGSQTQADESHSHESHSHVSKPPLESLMKCPLAFVGIHIQHDNRSNAVTAYHFCQLNKHGWTQCILYDRNVPDAKLIGVEYLVTDEVYKSMPPLEKIYWHPHDYEIDSGRRDAGLARKDGPLLLRSLTQSGEEEAATLEIVKTLWGKITHTWVKGERYPEGPSKLFWAATGENGFVLPNEFQVPPELKKDH